MPAAETGGGDAAPGRFVMCGYRPGAGSGAGGPGLGEKRGGLGKGWWGALWEGRPAAGRGVAEGWSAMKAVRMHRPSGGGLDLFKTRGKKD